MKKFLTLVLTLLIVLSLAGCYRANMLDKDALPPEEELTAQTEKTGAPQWGITMEAKDVTPKGMTLVIHQEGGVEVTGEINTGDPYALYRLEGDVWMEVPMIRDDIAWNAIAYLIPFGGELEQELNWSWMYGDLPAGEYKLVKGFMDFRGTGDYDQASFEVEFVVE